ncbi:50S ribosomal protein L4 [Microgenomates group bacterium RBG_19FT_COMBO_39_10]|nr:ribosomal protein L4 [uncultured bacterium]OGV89214.1 MAG: 50S ribosomal protein L4 [Microgenomates group bacterium RBG_19FT_COMBO_39_10]
MAKVDLYTITGRKAGQISLPKEIFEAKINKLLMAQAVKVYLSNQRKAGAKTKTRAEVAGSGRKIWRQKGTGRARHSDRYAPIFVGGGRAHSPTGKENYKLKMSKKMKRQALFSALTSKFKEEEIIAVKGLGKVEPKTKTMATILTKLPLKEKKKKEVKILLVLPEVLENVIRASRNLAGVQLVQANQLNPYQVLSQKQVVLMEESIKKLKETFLK